MVLSIIDQLINYNNKLHTQNNVLYNMMVSTQGQTHRQTHTH